MATSLAPGGAIFAVAMRLCGLDSLGNTPGQNTYTTNALVKLTATPVLETGDDIVVKSASGDIYNAAKHGDMIKYTTVSIELATPDPFLEALMAGGTVLSDSGTALGLPTGLTATAQTTLGTLAAGTYGYRVSQYNAYGETLCEAEVQVTTTGTTGAVVLSGVTLAAGALGARYYGRSPGLEQYLGSQANFAGQATSAASGTGAVASLTVTALTKPIPIGSTFQITGDTNTPKIVFTATATVGVGAVTVPVSASQTVTTTIAAGALIPVFVDSGSATPFGDLPTLDMTAGPGLGVGYQAPPNLSVANPNGVSVELYSKRWKNGVQATDYPYIRTVLPCVRNMHVMPRDWTDANLQNVFEGQAFPNPNWGSGPFGDWQFDSTEWIQRAVCGAQILPVPGIAAVIAPE
jgi:hypothetical protein